MIHGFELNFCLQSGLISTWWRMAVGQCRPLFKHTLNKPGLKSLQPIPLANTISQTHPLVHAPSRTGPCYCVCVIL